jgi:preprotein translocase subunit YajC
MLFALTHLLAQVEEKAGDQQTPGILELFGRNPILLFLALGAMFIFIVLLPQQRLEKKQRESLLAALKKNDEVLTQAGIIGVVWSIKEGGDEVTLKIDDNAKIRVLRSTIVKIITKETKEGA